MIEKPPEPVPRPVTVFRSINRNDDLYPQIPTLLWSDRNLQYAIPVLAKDPVSFDDVLQ